VVFLPKRTTWPAQSACGPGQEHPRPCAAIAHLLPYPVTAREVGDAITTNGHDLQVLMHLVPRRRRPGLTAQQQEAANELRGRDALSRGGAGHLPGRSPKGHGGCPARAARGAQAAPQGGVGEKEEIMAVSGSGSRVLLMENISRKLFLGKDLPRPSQFLRPHFSVTTDRIRPTRFLT